MRFRSNGRKAWPLQVARLVVLAERHPRKNPPDLTSRALAIFAAFEGALLVARGRGDVKVFDEIVSAYAAAGLFD